MGGRVTAKGTRPRVRHRLTVGPVSRSGLNIRMPGDAAHAVCACGKWSCITQREKVMDEYRKHVNPPAADPPAEQGTAE